MSIQLYVAPAATGKTAYALNLARETVRDLQAIPRVCLPTHLQIRSWRRRLAQNGGTLGVRLMTFDRLYAECLDSAGEVYTELSEPVQYRQIRSILDDLNLTYYTPLITHAGFVRILQEIIAELKAARVPPEIFSDAIARLGNEPRLAELAQIYTTYQNRLLEHAWADRAGLAWLAVESLEHCSHGSVCHWPLLIVDGFDNFTPVQIALLQSLVQRVDTTIITLTGMIGDNRELAYQRFNETRRQLEQAFNVEAQPLPEHNTSHKPVLNHLERNLFQRRTPSYGKTTDVECIESADRNGEVRAALRWLKKRLIIDKFKAGDLALLARSLPSYRPFILQTAAEFELPIRLVDGQPLKNNPAIAAILDLLRLMLPLTGDSSQPSMPRRLVIEAWRSPYFDWSMISEQQTSEATSIFSKDADTLDIVARWGKVIRGLSQWEEALEKLVNLSEDQVRGDEERDRPGHLPVGAEAQTLNDKFNYFVCRLSPPETNRCYREWVAWLEDIIGPDPNFDQDNAPDRLSSLQIVYRASEAAPEVAEMDIAALQALKDVLRGLVWAEDAIQDREIIDYPKFFRELSGLIEATSYHPPIQSEREEILVANVVQARGIPFEAVAVLGLAEGEFPASLREDTFLRDTDRERFRESFGLPLRPSTESAEPGFFYETITRPRSRLLLTRPRLADNGATWQASPFWEEILQRIEITPAKEDTPLPHLAASWPEILESLSTHPGYAGVKDWILETSPEVYKALERAVAVFRIRQTQNGDRCFDGDLGKLQSEFAQRFGPEHIWSISRLESYRACPFLFFVGNILALEPKEEPAEGLDARQLGNIYHRVFEMFYQRYPDNDPAGPEELLDMIRSVAQPILDEAPQQEGFRTTAWWLQTCEEIVKHIHNSLCALAEMPGGFVPLKHEACFWEPNMLIIQNGEDRLQLHGFIDRIDRDSSGHLRIIDYKTSHPNGFNSQAVSDGKKLQLPLYALAARDALGLGEPIEGFYWHIRHAEPSKFTLGSFAGGTEAALKVATRHAWAIAHEIRKGQFMPQPPDDGCPSYCPATGFCWHYRPGFGG